MMTIFVMMSDGIYIINIIYNYYILKYFYRSLGMVYQVQSIYY